ncbi:tRNA dimethylallyltransferase [Buchnera aphidicola (Eriosoma grossulariae)]|uniref:tRNA (adenosine(37)-N6)-dimethylallyltransferase MiaA n=1 Tax=Buchnera aphidicola TaxID=9 RepID=UPI00346422AA
MNIKKTLPIIIFIMGPTASGKTKMVFHLSKILPIDIISVDSGLIYRDMNIGTDKPSTQDLVKYPHKLVNIRDPIDIYSVEDFRNNALYEINKIVFNKRIPVLVGGTMFYYKSLLHGLASLPSTSYVIRSNLYQNFKDVENAILYQYLKKIDNEASLKIHPNNIKKILRVIEIFLVSGKNLTTYLKSEKDFYCFPYKVLQFFVMPFNRTVLHNRISARFKKMLDIGFEEEVKNLFYRGDLNPHLPSMQRVGYRQMWSYLSNKCSYDDMIFQSICATRQLAKKQITWSKKWDNLFILNSENFDFSIDIISKMISKYIKNNFFFYK